jgi:acetyl-CoA acetyltransferase
MTEPTLRGKTAIVGVGQSRYYKRGQSPDPAFVLTLQAILAACADAGIEPRSVDGFASFSNDRNEPLRLSAALGLKELRFNSMVWGGGGGGGSAALADAAAAVQAGIAGTVVVFRGLAQGAMRFGGAPPAAMISGNFAFMAAHGILSPAQQYAAKVIRFMHEHGVEQSALRAVALAAYAHAQNNPAAVMHGRPLDAAKYDASPWIVEPFHLYDCCLENDGAAAVIVTTAERARDLAQKPAYLLAAAQGAGFRTDAGSFNGPDFAGSHFGSLAPRLYAMAGVTPKDVDVLQSYENFTGGVVMSMAEHGFFAPEEANAFCTPENLSARGGKLPLNTSGGNLAEAYIHGMSLIVEAARQIQGRSTNQVPDVKISMVTSGPMAAPVSDCILGAEETL